MQCEYVKGHILIYELVTFSLSRVFQAVAPSCYCLDNAVRLCPFPHSRISPDFALSVLDGVCGSPGHVVGSLKLVLAGLTLGCNLCCMLWRAVPQWGHVPTLGHTAKLRTKSDSITGGSKPGVYKKFHREKLWSEDSPWHPAGLGLQQADWYRVVARICPSPWWGCLFRLYIGNLCQPYSEILDLLGEYAEGWEKERNV